MSFFDDTTCLDTTMELQKTAWDNFWEDVKYTYVPEYEFWSDWINHLLDKHNAKFCSNNAGHGFVKFATAEDKMMFMLRWA